MIGSSRNHVIIIILIISAQEELEGCPGGEPAPAGIH